MQSDLDSYDYFIVMLSGGKDSVACLLHLLEQGVPRSKIECWHHLVDGRESNLMDWPVTEDYCRVLCKTLNIQLYYSWHSGGLEQEMLRKDSATAATFFETPDGLKSSGGKGKKLGTRMRFAQPGADMKTRFCSPYAKIMVGDAAIANQSRFKGKRTLVLTGERRLESPARSKYLEFQPHSTHCQSRHVDHWRPVIDWSDEVWCMAERWSIKPHPCYFLGFGRASCEFCIFASNDQLASVYEIDPDRLQVVANYENLFSDYWKSQGALKNYTIHRTMSVMERVAKGKAFDMKSEHIKLALSCVYYEAITAPHGEWELPLGAMSKDMAGPS